MDDQVGDAIDTLRKLMIPLPPQFLILKPIYDIAKTATSLIGSATTERRSNCAQRAFQILGQIFGRQSGRPLRL
jgi:hypothetical protein